MSFRCAVSIACLCATTLFALSGCEKMQPEPIRVGFVAGLTGRSATVGLAARDGALLAIEQVNRAGGVDGRKVELIIKDIQQDEVAGRQALEDLFAARVPVIISPVFSTMAVALVPLVNKTETIMVSPTASTPLLGGKDDNFLRVLPQGSFIAKRLADYIARNRGLRRIAVIYDESNSAFTVAWKDSFAKSLEAMGGTIAAEVGFKSGGQHSFFDLVKEAASARPEGFLLLCNSLDTAMLTQQMLKLGVQRPVFATEWSMTRDLLHSGGRSVEGLAMLLVFNEASAKERYLNFKKAFKARFNQAPSFPAIHGYDAMSVVLSGLRMGARTGPELKEALLQVESFDALQTSFRFDSYGDVQRDLFLTVVKDGEFVVVE